MTQILSFDKKSPKVKKESPLKGLWDLFQSQDKFIKLSLITLALIIIATPFIVANRQIFTPKAATILPLSVTQLIATRPGHANPHAITFCDPPLYYSWGQHGTEDSKYKHPDSGTLGSWYAIHRDCSILNTALNARFNIRRIAIWNHQPSNNTWVKTYDGLPQWNVNTDPAYGSYVDNAPKIESDGSYSFALPQGRSLHGAQGNWPHINEGDGVIAIIEARLLGSASDIAAAAKVGATAGADYRDAKATGGDSSPGYYQSGFGQISLLNGNWQAYYMVSSTLTDAQILANPPSEFTTLVSSPTPTSAPTPTPQITSTQILTPTPTQQVQVTCVQVDFDHDGKISVLDLARMAKSYGTKVGDPKYNPIYDLNKDGYINRADLDIAATFFGKTCN